MPAFRFKCRNIKCGSEFHRQFSNEEFERQQYGSPSGWCCFNCGMEKMGVMRSNRAVKDTFQPGFQRNIGEYCKTYSEYKRKLKEKGLIELGYEDIPMDDRPDDSTAHYWTDEFLRDLYEDCGITLDGQLIEALRNGRLQDIPGVV